MKKVLVTGGGTGAAWHICNVAKDHFSGRLEIILCDADTPILIPARTLVSKIYKVPKCDENPENDAEYYNTMCQVLEEEHIDAIIPLIDAEAYLFPSDSEYLLKNSIYTTAPPLNTVEQIHDKLLLNHFLNKCLIPTPKLIDIKDVSTDITYIVKPRKGYGSMGVRTILGKDIIEKTTSGIPINDYIIQEYCDGEDYEEVTVEVFNYNRIVKMFARKRITVKAGVCTKMEPFDTKPFEEYIMRIIDEIECPPAFNIQFLYHEGVWKLYDFNLRLPAGTAMSSAVGFQMTRALLRAIVGEQISDELFQVDKSIKNVMRVYQEIVVR